MTEVDEKIATLEIEVQKQRKVYYMIISTVIVINITNCFLVIKLNRLLDVIDKITDLVYRLMN